MNSAVHVSHKNFKYTVLYVIHNILNSIEFESERQDLIEFKRRVKMCMHILEQLVRDSEG